VRLDWERAADYRCRFFLPTVANSRAPPVLVAFGDYDAMRLRQFAAEHGGAVVERWQSFVAPSLFSAAAE
jgi:hypothetical protein